jgi:hypothetical protein
MTPRFLSLGWTLAAVLAASLASAEPRMTVAPASAPPNVAALTRVALHDAVVSDLASDESASMLSGYKLFPKLVQLRRYVEGNQKTPTSVCVVELTVVDGSGKVVARTRAAANSQSANERETLEAAAQAASTRLSVSLAALSRAERDRLARR